MRHGDKVNNLGRKVGHRKALLRNMTKSLIEHKRIFTTLAKAKALRLFVEPLLTKAKDNTTHSRRVVFSYLQQKESVTELFEVIAPKIMDRPGGYVRIIKTGFRLGDSAEMAMIELVDFNDVYVKGVSKEEADKAKKKTRRSGAAKKKTEPVAKETAPATTEETTEES